MRRRVLVAGLTALLGSASAWAQTAPAVLSAELGTPAGPPRLSMTIYNGDLALLEERRSLDLPAGRSRQEFRDVSAAIRPETVSLSASGVGIVEQNFDFDLLTPDKLMQEAVGQRITVVRTNPGTGAETRETATVLAANQGVVLRIGDRIEVLRDDGVPTRVIFDQVPPNLRARPTLSVTLQADRAGRRDAVLSYLTTGLSWRADYVALYDETTKRLDFQGWITLTNQTGTGFSDADVQVVAGDLNLLSGGGYNRYNRGFVPPPPPSPGGFAGTETGTGPRLGDYYIYPLPQRTSVEQNQTKQVGFIDAQGVAAQRVYYFRPQGFGSSGGPQSVDVGLEFSNARAAGLGRQLPAGIVRVYQRDSSGDPKFIGENSISHTPAGSQMGVRTGEAFDVTVQSTLVRQETLTDRVSQVEMRYDIRNARPEAVTVGLRQGSVGSNTRVLRESQPSTRVDANSIGWNARVPANGSTVLTFLLETDTRERPGRIGRVPPPPPTR